MQKKAAESSSVSSICLPRVLSSPQAPSRPALDTLRLAGFRVLFEFSDFQKRIHTLLRIFQKESSPFLVTHSVTLGKKKKKKLRTEIASILGP